MPKRLTKGRRNRAPSTQQGLSVVGIAWYKGEDYETLKRLFADGDQLPTTYEEWLRMAKRVFRELSGQGFDVRPVPIDPEKFPVWCASKGLAIDAIARTRYSAESVRALSDRGAS